MERIRHRTQFDAVMSGPPVVKTPHFALHMVDSLASGRDPETFPGGGLWLGVMIPKRWAKHAVTRNTLRRQIYAVAQELSPSLPEQAMVVRLRSSFSRKEFVSATSDRLRAAARAELLHLLGDKLSRRLALAAPHLAVPGGGSA